MGTPVRYIEKLHEKAKKELESFYNLSEFSFPEFELINFYLINQNGFGATLRTSFTGKIKQVSKNQWKLISLNFP